MTSALRRLRIRVPNVANVVKTFGDLQGMPKLLTSFATRKLSCNKALGRCNPVPLAIVKKTENAMLLTGRFHLNPKTEF